MNLEERKYSTPSYEDAYNSLDYTMQLATDNTSSNSTIEASENQRNWAAMAVIPIIAFVAMGNILVIMAVKMDHKLRSSTNYFLTSLAVADLLVAITVMPPSLAMIINNYAWPFPKGLCGIWVMLDVCFSTSSILHLCMISLDRYLALANPFRYNSGGWLSKNSSGGWGTDKKGNSKWRIGTGHSGGASKMTKRVAKRILIVWAIAIGISLPIPILANQNPNNLFVDELCTINIPEFALCGSFVAFFFPLIVMFITYSLTIRTLHKQSKLVACIMGKDGSTHKGRLSSSSSITSRRSNNKASRKSQGSTREISGKWTSGVTEPTSLPEINSLTDNEQCSEYFSRTNHRRDGSSDSGIHFTANPTESRFKACARCLLRKMLCCSCHGTKNNSQENELMDSEYNDGGSRTTLQKSDSDSSDSISLTNQSIKRSPMIVRANQTLAKAIAKLPLKRVSTRRISASMKSKAIATEQRASKVLGMIFTLFCLFWCPFFITNSFMGFCELGILKSCDMAVMGNLMNWFVWVGYVSSGVNPCVYTLFSKQFRETFRKLILRQYDQIGHRQFSRSFPQTRGAGGISTSSFRGRDFSDSMDLRDVLRDENTKVSATVYRSLGESVVRRQHKRSQVTRSADTELLTGDNNNSQIVEKDLKAQWRTTWHSLTEEHTNYILEDDKFFTEQRDAKSKNRKKSTVKFADEKVGRERYHGRLMSEPNPSNRMELERCFKEENYFSLPKSRTNLEEQHKNSSDRSPTTLTETANNFPPFHQRTVTSRRQQDFSENSRYHAIAEHTGVNSSGDESEYENINCDDVFTMDKTPLHHQNNCFTTNSVTHNSVNTSPVLSTNCESCDKKLPSSSDKQERVSLNPQTNNVPNNLVEDDITFIDYCLESDVDNPNMQNENNSEKQRYTKLIRLDSGMGESVRDSQGS